jgi:hypothetical protein
MSFVAGKEAGCNFAEFRMTFKYNGFSDNLTISLIKE